MTTEIDESSSNSIGSLELVRRAADGDEAALELLFDRFRDHLRQFIELRLDPRVRQRVDPSDVVQEAQLEVHQRLRDFLERRPMPLRIWLRQTAMKRLERIHETHLRAKQRSVRSEEIIATNSSAVFARRLLSSDPTPFAQAQRHEREQAVAAAIHQLSEVDREILILRNVEGLGYDEIAFSLNTTREAARKRFGRALVRLQKQLRNDLGDLFHE